MEMAFMAKGGSFPDLTGDGKVTKKDILRGRGVEGFGEGGLKDQGGTKDKVSGNDVPSGSLQKEVRDDIPAMVSEGEFIFPADVVRYHGLDKLMQMRQEAKMGLNMMEKMGQLGNSEEAEIPDDLPFTVADITIVEESDDKEMSQGGILFAQEGTDVANQERAAFSDFMGSTGYEPKGPRKYKLKNGDIIEIVHNYRDIPTQIVPEGAVLLPLDDTTPVTPKEGEGGEQAATAPKKKEKTAAERQAKADATAARNKEAIETSAKRLGMTAEEYGKLGFGSRLALMGLELKGARGETVTTEERNAAIEKSKEGGAFGGLLGGLGAALEKFLGKIGFDVDGDGKPFSSSRIKNPETGEWEDPITDKVTNKADGTEVTEDEITYDTKGNAPFTDSKKPTGTIFSSPSQDQTSTLRSEPEERSDIQPIQNTRPDALDMTGTSALQDSAGVQVPTIGDESSSLRKILIKNPETGEWVAQDTNPKVQESIGAYTKPNISQPQKLDMSSQMNQALPNVSMTDAQRQRQGQNIFGLGSGIDPAYTQAAQAATVESTAKNLEQSSQEADAMLKRAQALRESQALQQKELDVIDSGIKKLEGSLLSGNDMARTEARRKIVTPKDMADKKKEDDKRRKRREDRKKSVKKTYKDKEEGSARVKESLKRSQSTGRGPTGFKRGGLMKRNYP